MIRNPTALLDFPPPRRRVFGVPVSKWPRIAADIIAMADVIDGIPTPPASRAGEDLLAKIVQGHLARSGAAQPAAATAVLADTPPAPPEATPRSSATSDTPSYGQRATGDASPLSLDDQIAALLDDAAAPADNSSRGRAEEATPAPAHSANSALDDQIASLLETATDSAHDELAAHAPEAAVTPVENDATVSGEPFAATQSAPLQPISTEAELPGDAELSIAPSLEPSAEPSAEPSGADSTAHSEIVNPAEMPMPQVISGSVETPDTASMEFVETSPPAAAALVSSPSSPADVTSATDAVMEAPVSAAEAAALATPENAQPPSAQQAVATRSGGFMHDLSLMIAQLFDMPFARLPKTFKHAAGLAGALFILGGAALVVVARLSH